ncbi:MAG: methyltransferase protein [Nitrosarchaeum sp.]|nr:methyltransferase protein [Nitrosarchaeum sp.]
MKLKENFADLGQSPFSNSFLKKKDLKKKEKKFPLHVYVCTNCLLVQLEEFQTPKNIFSEYAYFSSYSKTWLKHVEDYVGMMIKKYNYDKNSNIVEIASNDGYLLQYFLKKKISVLGIEPAKNIAKIARKKGIPTVTKFFGIETAKELATRNKKADLLIGNNVLAHVPDLNDFISGLRILLKSKGIITLEFPHILKLIQKNQFDTIYHEHFSYFSLLALKKIFSFHNLVIFDVDKLSTHGGSLRIYVKHKEDKTKKNSSKIHSLIKEEKQMGLDKISTYRNFQEKIIKLQNNIQKFFFDAKKKNNIVVGYGAPAKGNTLLNFCKIDTKFIKYTVDKNPYKQGLFLPGSHIPIKKPEKIHETKPDYVFILPWNLKDEIIKEIEYVRKWGCKFVIPIPKISIK